MKISRRTAIKGIGASMATTAAAPALSARALSADAFSIIDDNSANPAQTDKLNVQVAHQWGKESIVAVIKNTSDHSTTITDINSVAAEYGRFNFESLTRNGPLTLSAGEEVHVPFTVMGTPVTPYGHFDNRLQKQLKKALKISTASRSTKVATAMGPKLV